jgi:hypothetical protein
MDYMAARMDEQIEGAQVTYAEMHAEIDLLRALLLRALPMVDTLDATKTSCVWNLQLQTDAAVLARELRAALKPNVELSGLTRTRGKSDPAPGYAAPAAKDKNDGRPACI